MNLMQQGSFKYQDIESPLLFCRKNGTMKELRKKELHLYNARNSLFTLYMSASFLSEYIFWRFCIIFIFLGGKVFIHKASK